MRALTIRPIWLHMCVTKYRGFSPKRVENRQDRNGNAGQPCAHRGPLLLHASQRQARREFDEVVAAMLQQRRGPLLSSKAPALEDLACGGIVAYTTALGHLRPNGTADTTDGELTAAQVRKRFDLRWWSGGHALLFGDVEPLPFVVCGGALNAWQVQPEVLAELERLGWRFGADGKPIRRRKGRWLSTLGPCREPAT